MDRLFDSFDLVFALGGIAIAVIAICLSCRMFYGEKLTFELNPAKSEKPEPGIKFALVCGAVLACAFGIFLYWLRA